MNPGCHARHVSCELLLISLVASSGKHQASDLTQQSKSRVEVFELKFMKFGRQDGQRQEMILYQMILKISEKEIVRV